LPDGDIDISIFIKDPDNSAGLRDTWAMQLQQSLEEEASNPLARFRIADVHIVHAEASRPSDLPLRG
jgi:hypothetical protein